MKHSRYLPYLYFAFTTILFVANAYALEITPTSSHEIPVHINIRQKNSSTAIVELDLQKNLTIPQDSTILNPSNFGRIRLNLNSSAKSIRLTILKARGAFWKSLKSWIVRSPRPINNSGTYNYYQRGMNLELGTLYIPLTQPIIEIQLPIDPTESQNDGQLSIQIDEINQNDLWNLKIISKDNLLKNRLGFTNLVLSSVERESSIYRKELQEIQKMIAEYDEICHELLTTWNLDSEYSIANLTIDDQTMPFGTDMSTEKLQQWHSLRQKIYSHLQKMKEFLENETNFQYSPEEKINIALSLALWSSPTYLGQLEYFFHAAPCSMNPECSQSYHQWLSWMEKFKDKNGLGNPLLSSDERMIDTESFLHTQSTRELMKDLKAYRTYKNQNRSNENIEVKNEK